MPRRKPKPRVTQRQRRGEVEQRRKPITKGTSACRTGKTRYGDRSEALRVLRAIQATSTRERVPQNVYDDPCEHCGGFHLTGLPTATKPIEHHYR
jgi:hypothetical protein